MAERHYSYAWVSVLGENGRPSAEALCALGREGSRVVPGMLLQSGQGAYVLVETRTKDE